MVEMEGTESLMSFDLSGRGWENGAALARLIVDRPPGDFSSHG